MRTHFLQQPWVIRASVIHGKGVFAHRAIKKGEKVFTVQGPRIMYPDEPFWRLGPDWLHIGTHTYIVAKFDSPWIFLNHSCNPNAILTRGYRVVALRPIRPREEVTIDYAFTEAGAHWHMQCTCRKQNCRRRITAIQYMPEAHVRKYWKYILPHLKGVYLKEKVEVVRRGAGTVLIAKHTMRRGERVFTVEGPVIRYSFPPASHLGFYWLGIGKNKWLIPYRNNPWKAMRHSCMPNVGVNDAHQVKALRTIRRGEEITIDDSTTEADPNWKVHCTCGARNCRKVVRSIHFLPKSAFRHAMPYIPTYMQKMYRAEKQRKG